MTEGEDLKTRPFIQLLFNLDVIRIYYPEEKIFFLSHTFLNGIYPLVDKKAIVIRKKITEIIREKIGDNFGLLECTFYYPSTIKQCLKNEIKKNNKTTI